MMEIKQVIRAEMKIAGMQVRTSNAQEASEAGKIPGLWQQYMQQSVGERTPGKVNPVVTIALYTDYESDVNGEYTLVIGAEVENPDAVSQVEGLTLHTVPAAKYLVFTTEKGPFGEVVIAAWQRIWAYFEQSEVKRAYTGDFEWYDERSWNPNEAIVDIYIAIES